VSDTLLNIQAGTLPVDCYPASADTFQKLALSLARAVFPSPVFGIGDTAPTDHTIPWFRTDSANNFIRTYTWGGYGNWVSPHPVPPADARRFIWVGLESDLVTLDEGTSDPITDTTGPFWVVDHGPDGRFPIASTTGAVHPLPSGLVIPPTGTGGEEAHSLTVPEMPPHVHHFKVEANNTAAQGSGVLTGGDDNATSPRPDGKFEGNTDSAGGNTDTPPVVVAHNNMPPYYGVFLIRRTARIFFTA